jgi:hypothetical protein
MVTVIRINVNVLVEVWECQQHFAANNLFNTIKSLLLFFTPYKFCVL